MYYVTQQWNPPAKVDVMGSIRRVARVGLVAAVAAAAPACAPPGPPDTSLFTSPCLTEGSLSGVRPSKPVDYLELRERLGTSGYHVLSANGTVCDSSTNPVDCQARFTALPTAPGFHPCYQRDCGHSLAMTRGDAVQSYTNTKDLLAFLGPIDTPMDAVLYVYAQGYNVSCVDPSTGGVRQSVDGNGFEVLVSLVSHHCNPTTITGYHYHVTSDGQLLQLGSWPVSSFNGEPCQ
jgi:hypothetical protein